MINAWHDSSSECAGCAPNSISSPSSLSHTSAAVTVTGTLAIRRSVASSTRKVPISNGRGIPLRCKADKS